MTTKDVLGNLNMKMVYIFSIINYLNSFLWKSRNLKKQQSRVVGALGY